MKFTAYQKKLAKTILKVIADNPGISWADICDKIGRRQMNFDSMRNLLMGGNEPLMLPPCHTDLWTNYPEEFYITEKGRLFLAD